METSETDQDYVELKGYLKVRGFDVSYYRDPFIQRRLNLRLSRNKVQSYGEYLALLKKTPDEYQKLVDCLAVNVTSFFRDGMPFRLLGTEVLPQIMADKKRKGSSRIHVWSAACSTGEEPYSIAMTVMEFLESELKQGLRVSITATDIDQEALAHAQRGEYALSALKDVETGGVRRYFEEKKGKLKVSDEIRLMVNFKTKDLIKDDPVLNTDLIFCRNMLIYIPMVNQEIIFRKFASSLNSGGFLILGNTESLPDFLDDTFKTVNSSQRIYRKD